MADGSTEVKVDIAGLTFTCAAFCICGGGRFKMDVPFDEVGWFATKFAMEHTGEGHGPVSDEEWRERYERWYAPHRKEEG